MMNHDEIITFWNNYANQYSAFQQGDVPIRIINRLFELNALKPEYSVLEIGSGPGTYSLKISPRVRILTCMDSSKNMLDRLSKSIEECRYNNIELFLKDWREYVPKKGYDACIATLCPNSGSEESLIRMENSARKSCIIVSWHTNQGDDLNEKIWKKLGQDHSYSLRKSTFVQDWLKDNERDYKIEMFETHMIYDVPSTEVIAHEKSAFEAYGQKDVEAIVKELLDPITEDGMVHFDHVNKMKLICWKTPDNAK